MNSSNKRNLFPSKSHLLTIIQAILSLTLISFSTSVTLEEKLILFSREEDKLITKHMFSQMTSLLIQSNENEDAELQLGCSNNFFTFLLRGIHEDFILNSMEHPVLSINKNDDLIIFSNHFSPRNGLKFSGDFKIRGINQWKQIVDENFDSGKAEGWSNNTVSTCNGVFMLGGYCHYGKGETTKTYYDLPEHTYIKIEATYHFIDAWDGETGYMKINNGRNDEMVYVWTEQYSSIQGNNGINICGGKYPEGKFASPIKIIEEHNKDSLTITFGSTITLDPCDESFGVSGIRIYIR